MEYEAFDTTGVSENITEIILLHTTLTDIIKLFKLNKKAYRNLIYKLMPGIIKNNYDYYKELNFFYEQLLMMNETMLLKRTVNEAYKLKQDISHFLRILMYAISIRNGLNINYLTIFWYILPNYEIDDLVFAFLSFIRMTNFETQTIFMIGGLRYSINNNFIKYMKTVVDYYNVNMIDGHIINNELKQLIKDATIILDLHNEKV